MNNLPRVIGLAPSELAPLEFRARLEKERARVRAEIERFQQKNIPKSSAAKAAKATRKKLNKLMKEKGMTLEKLQEILAKKKGKE